VFDVWNVCTKVDVKTLVNNSISKSLLIFFLIFAHIAFQLRKARNKKIMLYIIKLRKVRMYVEVKSRYFHDNIAVRCIIGTYQHNMGQIHNFYELMCFQGHTESTMLPLPCYRNLWNSPTPTTFQIVRWSDDRHIYFCCSGLQSGGNAILIVSILKFMNTLIHAYQSL